MFSFCWHLRIFDVDQKDGDVTRVSRILESGEVGVNAADETGITAAQVRELGRLKKVEVLNCIPD